MYHSITFGDKNTWDDWHLISPERPYFNPPEQKTMLIDVPGSTGILDISESLTGYPIFNNREGTFDFLIMNGYRDWVASYNDIMEYLHGKTMRATLEDDPNNYYYGRFTVSKWQSTHPWSQISISYNVEPYKWSIYDSTQDWLWDPFVFATDTTFVSPFNSVSVDSDSFIQMKFEEYDFGGAPVCPEFIVETSDNKGMDVKYVNTEFGINRETHFPDGVSFDPGLVLYRDTEFSIFFKGHGTFTAKYRIGRL